MKMKQRFAAFFLASVLVSTAAPLGALAGTRSLWPNQFTAVGDTSEAYAAFDVLGGNAAIFECEVKLPVGTTITRFMVNAASFGGPVAAILYRRKMDGLNEPVAGAPVPEGGLRNWYIAPSIDSGFARVAANYKYWVRLHIANGASVYGAKISYR